MITVKISRAWCDEHMGDCWHSYNENTGESKHVDSYTAECKRLEAQGYYYAGHRRGVFTYHLTKSAPLALPLDWQMAIEAKGPEYIDINQDW